MAERTSAGERRSVSAWMALALERIAERRLLVAVAVVAVLFVAIFADRAVISVAAAVFAIVLAAAILPAPPLQRRQTPGMAVESDGGVGALTVSELGAAVSDPLIVFDRLGRVVYTNEAARAAFGALAPGTAIELRFRAPEMQDLLRRALTEGSAPIAIDYAERVPIERWYRVVVTTVGNDGLSVLVFRDQSETRRIDRMRSDFIANASHELRTPLASIAGFIETLRGPARNDAAARENFLQIMQNQTARMARLIDDLLSLSRLEMKTYLKPGQTVDLKLVVESVVDSLSPMAAESGVTIERALGDANAQVAGDRDELIQVFENLLENALKYGQSGGRVVVRLENPANDAEVQVTIQDFGPGIAEEHIPRITERFYRVDIENSRAQKGTGLGLAIVKHILTRHNARLAIRSAAGQGASFTVHMPSAVRRNPARERE